MAEALALLVDALEEMAHTPMDQAMTHWPLLSEERKTLDGLFQFHRFQSRFAIRLAVVLCLSFTFVYLTQWPFAYWYPMTAVSYTHLLPQSKPVAPSKNAGATQPALSLPAGSRCAIMDPVIIMELRKLVCFLQICTCDSLSQAGRRLYMSQQGVSRLVHSCV